MKRLLLTIVCMAFCLLKTQAQNDTVFNVTQTLYYGNHLEICATSYDRVIIYAPENCNGSWRIQSYLGSYSYYDNPLILVFSENDWFDYSITFYSHCDDYDDIYFWIKFVGPFAPSETTTEFWKREEDIVTLESSTEPYTDWPYHYLWNTGETTATIEVSESGIYICNIFNVCAASVEQTFIVRNNVELNQATVDLETNLNKVTWQVTPEQAGYISEVKVERDGFVVGTAPYGQGYFMDNIGSENAARNYRLTGITTEGTECPIPSYQKGTLHVDYSPNASNPNKLNMAWTPPFIEEDAPVSVTYFQICKYDPTTGEVTVIDQLGANNTIASYNRDLFGGGYAVIGVVFNDGRADEEVSFSNRSEDIIMAVGEQQGEDFRIYPNPAQSRVTIEGTGKMTVTNTLGQTIFTKDIDGKTTIDLPQGLYFVKMNGVTRKVVVE